MKFEIIKTGNLLEVQATVKSRKLARDPVQSIRTKQVLDFLKDQGYNVGEYDVVVEGSCTNLNANSKTTDNWKLRKKEVKNVSENNRTSKSRRQQRKRTTQKNQLLRNEDLGGMQSQTQADLPGQDQ